MVVKQWEDAYKKMGPMAQKQVDNMTMYDFMGTVKFAHTTGTKLSVGCPEYGQILDFVWEVFPK